jgi:hypothetical protein
LTHPVDPPRVDQGERSTAPMSQAPPWGRGIPR